MSKRDCAFCANAEYCDTVPYGPHCAFVENDDALDYDNMKADAEWRDEAFWNERQRENN